MTNISSTRSRSPRTNASISPEGLATATTPSAVPLRKIGAVAASTVPLTVSSPVSRIMPLAMVPATSARS